MNARLHYIHDPLCGWCHGTSPLVAAALDAFGQRLGLELHAAGLFVPAQGVDAALASELYQTDQQITELSGQPFGEAYRQGLLAEDGTVLHSLPPIRAVLAAQRLDPALAWPMLQAIQQAHFQQGLRVVEADLLTELAESLALDAAAFTEAWQAVDEAAVQAHLTQSQQLLQHVSAKGFPSLLLEQHGQLQRLDHSAFFGQPHAFVQALAKQLDVVH